MSTVKVVFEFPDEDIIRRRKRVPRKGEIITHPDVEGEFRITNIVRKLGSGTDMFEEHIHVELKSIRTRN